MQAQVERTSVVAAEVADLDDPERLGRVRVRYPHLDNQLSDWARTVQPGAGPGRGARVIPEVGDEVLVLHEHGDPRRPYVIGGLWSRVDTPPADDGQPTDNNSRFFTSRSGHVIRLDDTQGAEKIEIIDGSGGNSIVIDTASNAITVNATQSVTVKAQTVTIEAQTIEVKGNASISVTAPTLDLSAQSAMTIDGGGVLTLRGAIVNIN